MKSVKLRDTITPMQIFELFGILLISLCPILISVYIYYSLLRRIKAIKKARLNLEKIISLLYIKSGEFDDFDYDYLNNNETSQLKNFHNSLVISNSSVITDNCSRLIKEFNEKEKLEIIEFNEKGKIVVSSGACIGVVLFVLLI